MHDLLLPEDVHTFEEGTEESMGRRLQWHTIEVIFHLLISYYPIICILLLPY